MTDENNRAKAPESGMNRMVGIGVFVLAFVLVAGGVLVLRQVVMKSGQGQPGGGSGVVGGTGATGATPTAALETQLAAARDAMAEQDYARAAALLGRAAEDFPTDQGTHLLYAQSLVTQKKFKEAYSEYEAAISLTPKTEAAARGGVGDPKLHFEAGTIANQIGMTERAEEHYSMAQTGDPTEPRYPLYLAMVQIKLGKDGPAMASLIRATKLNPELAVGWGTLAELALKTNSLGLAMQHVEKARALEPSSARWRLVEARVLNRRGEEGDVERALTMLLAMDKADRVRPEVLSAMGESYGLLKKPAEAAGMYAEASRLRPGDAELAYQASLWYQRAGNEEEAVRFGKLAQRLTAEAGSKE